MPKWERPTLWYRRSLFCNRLKLFVHLSIVFLVIATCRILHPILMLKVPLNGLPDAILEHSLRRPPDFRLDLIRCDRITSVMAFPVLDICDQIPGYKLLSQVVIRKLLWSVSRMMLMISIFCFSLCPPIL